MADYDTGAVSGVSVGQTNYGSVSLEPQFDIGDESAVVVGVNFGSLPLEALANAGIVWDLSDSQGDPTGEVVRTHPRLVRTF